MLLSGTWLLVAPEGHAEAAELAGRVALALERHGARPVRLDVAATVDRAELALAIRESAAGETAGEAAGEAAGEVAGILSLLPLDETPSAGRPALTAGTAAPCC